MEDVREHIPLYVPYCLCSQTPAHPQCIWNLDMTTYFQGYVYSQDICKTFHSDGELATFSLLIAESKDLSCNTSVTKGR